MSEPPAAYSARRVRPYRLRVLEPPEAAVLAAVLRYLSLDPRVAWSHRMNSGSYAVEENGKRRFIRYGFPGCPDILGQLRGGKSLLMEVKKHGGKLTDAQRAFLTRARENGAVAGVVRSVDEAKKLIDAAFAESVLHCDSGGES